MDDKSIKKGSGLVTAGLVLGIVAISLSFIPIVNNASVVLGALALIFGVIGLIKKTKKFAKALTAVILGVLSIVIALVLQAVWVDTIDDAVDELNDTVATATGDKTDELLQSSVGVKLGGFVVEEGEYTTNTSLPVEVENKNDTPKSFSISIEAVDASGVRLDEDTVYVNDLGAGQKQAVKAFEYVTSDLQSQLQNATFKVYKVSQY